MTYLLKKVKQSLKTVGLDVKEMERKTIEDILTDYKKALTAHIMYQKLVDYMIG